MPQLDFNSFFVQIFWIIILMYTTHCLYLYLYLVFTVLIVKLRIYMNPKKKLFSFENSNKLWGKCMTYILKSKNN